MIKKRKYEADLYEKSRISISCYADSEEEARSVLESVVKDSDKYIMKFKNFPEPSTPVRFNESKDLQDQNPIRYKIVNDHIPDEMTQPQINQLDDIDNAAHELCKIMLGNANLNWDMNIIGDVADAVAEVLVKKGLKVYFPAMVEDSETGLSRVVDYYGE